MQHLEFSGAVRYTRIYVVRQLRVKANCLLHVTYGLTVKNFIVLRGGCFHLLHDCNNKNFLFLSKELFSCS